MHSSCLEFSKLALLHIDVFITHFETYIYSRDENFSCRPFQKIEIYQSTVLMDVENDKTCWNNIRVSSQADYRPI